MNISLFGLTIDKSGAVQAIKEVTDKSAHMAQDGAKSAQLYADAFQEKLNRVARQYIPETMRAIDALQARERSLATTQRTLIDGSLYHGTLKDADRDYDALIHKMKGLEDATDGVTDSLHRGTASHEPHIRGLSRIGNSLASMVGHATGVPPVLEKVGDAIGVMAIGHLATVGVFAGFAALAFAYEKLTEKAKEAAQQAEETRKEFDKIAHMGVKGQGDAASLLYSGDQFSSDPLKIASLKELERQRDDFRQRANAVMTYAGGSGGGGGAYISRDARESAAALQRVNEELERRENLLASITAPGVGTISRAGVVQAAEDKPGFITDDIKAREQAAKEAARKEVELRKQINDVLRASEEGGDARTKGRGIKASEGYAALQEELDASARLLAATRAGVQAQREATDEEKAYQMVEKAGIMLDDARFQDALKSAEAIVANTRAVKDLDAARKASDEATKKSAAEVAAAQKKAIRDTEQLVKSPITTLITELANGKNAVMAFFDSLRQGLIKLLADIVAQRLTAKIAGVIVPLLAPSVAGAMQSGGMGGGENGGWAVPDSAIGLGAAGKGSAAMGYGAIALGGFGAGYGIGMSSGGNRGASALGGAASGAAMGAMIGSVVPVIGTAIGAVIGGVTGFVGGMVGASSAAKAAAKQMAEAQKMLADSIATVQAQIAHNSLAVALAQNHTQFDQLRKQTEDAYAGGKNEAARNVILAQLNTLEATRVQQLKEEFAAQQKYALEDLAVRKLRAEGKLFEADALAFAEQQQREYEQAVRDGRDATYLATLAETQRAEAINRTSNALVTAVRNAPSGFKVQGYAYDFSTPAARPAPPAGPTFDLRGATIGITGASGRALATDFLRTLRTMASEVTGTNVPLSQALDRLPS